MSPKALGNVAALRESSCGTGPFQVTEFNPGVFVKYKKNPTYWREGKPYLDGLEMYMVEESTTRSSAFMAGEYDMVLMNDLTVAQELIDAGDKYVMEVNKSGQGLIGTGLIPNSSDPASPFKDAKVRQAMCYAIDAEALCKTFGYGLLRATNQWAAPGAVTYNPAVKGYPYSIAKAKALLAEAGYPNGFATTLTTNPGNKDIFTAAANMLSEAGIRCEINLVDEMAQVHLYSTGTWKGIMGHFHSITPDLGLYMGRHLDRNGAFYAAGIQHPDNAMDLLAAIRTAASEKEKIDLEFAMQILIYDDLALFGKPVFVQNEPVFKSNYVMDDDRSIVQVSCWSPENAWFNK
jgi:peptide/nickel transport system substrate-binding protein